VQDLVDRRFNRQRNDAARTVEAFAVRLREQVDLNVLSAELLVVVDHTVQPTEASPWLCRRPLCGCRGSRATGRPRPYSPVNPTPKTGRC
jgi:hypothetical protein